MNAYCPRALVNALGLVVALAITLVVPTGYALLGYTAEAGRLAFEARLNASRVATYVFQHGAMWPYHRVRLAELIELTSYDEDAVRQRIYNAQGKLVLEEGPQLSTPVIMRSAPILATGQAVGWIEVETSAGPLIGRTLAI